MQKKSTNKSKKLAGSIKTERVHIKSIENAKSKNIQQYIRPIASVKTSLLIYCMLDSFMLHILTDCVKWVPASFIHLFISYFLSFIHQYINNKTQYSAVVIPCEESAAKKNGLLRWLKELRVRFDAKEEWVSFSFFFFRKCSSISFRKKINYNMIWSNFVLLSF